MKYIFDETQHLHVGYYENGFDIESTVYKIVDQDAWVMYVEWESIKGKFSKIFKYDIDPLNSLEIMCILESDVRYEIAEFLFGKWLRNLKIVY